MNRIDDLANARAGPLKHTVHNVSFDLPCLVIKTHFVPILTFIDLASKDTRCKLTIWNERYRNGILNVCISWIEEPLRLQISVHELHGNVTPGEYMPSLRQESSVAWQRSRNLLIGRSDSLKRSRERSQADSENVNLTKLHWLWRMPMDLNSNVYEGGDNH